MLLREVDLNAESAVAEAIIALRLRVWAAQVPFALTTDDLIDPFDQVARHWAAFDGRLPVAAARLSVHDRLEDVPEADCLLGVFSSPPSRPIAFLSRLVVAEEYRRRGLGRQLDEIRIRAAEQAGCGSILGLVFDVSGESRVKRFLEYGFTVRGRGPRDTHPTFAQLPGPVVVERVIIPARKSLTEDGSAERSIALPSGSPIAKMAEEAAETSPAQQRPLPNSM